MFRFAVLSLILAYVQGSVIPRVPTLDGRIVGGFPAEITEAPYQVALLFDPAASGHYRHVCGGSIIASKIVLTAAHCTDKTYPYQWKVRAGSTYHNRGGQVMNLAEIVQHERFDNVDYDVALMFLSSELVLSDFAAIVPLPTQGQVVQDGAPGFITGWGYLSEGGIHPNNLYKLTLPTINQEKCIEAYKDFSEITPRMICAGKLGVGGQDACQGDSGGPMVIDGILIGVTSFGKGCANPDYPGVWARLPEFRQWIDEHLSS